jgi:hypothetical protein
MPRNEDRPLHAIADATFVDNRVKFRMSLVDQLLLSLTRRILVDRSLGGIAVVQLPRSRNQSALLLAICAHLLCRREQELLPGPVVFAGLDTAVTDQLRNLAVEKRHRVDLAAGNPLSAHRLTRSGELQPLLGTRVDPVDSALIYFNSRVGCPKLWCNRPLVILDATSVTNPGARRRLLTWADHEAAAGIVIVGDLGDDYLIELAQSAACSPLLLAVTDAEVRELTAGNESCVPPASILPSTSILCRRPAPVVIHRCSSEEADEALYRALQCLAQRPRGTGLPPEVALVARSLRAGCRLAARATDYRAACTYNPRPGELPPLSQIDRLQLHGQAAWRPWAITSWGALKTAVKMLWKLIEEENPKLSALWHVLETVDRAGARNILIRCHSPAAAEALRWSLSTGSRIEAQAELWDRISARVTIETFRERFPAGSYDAQILTGAPPPWLFSLLLGIEAKETHIITYQAEHAILQGYGQRWAEKLTQQRAATATALGVACPVAVQAPVLGAGERDTTSTIELPELAAISLEEILDEAERMDDVPVSHLPGAFRPHTPMEGPKDCVPVHLRNGAIWWCVNEGDRQTPVLTLGVSGHQYRPVSDLRPGDRIVVPAGDGIESVHARLLALRRSSDDVRQIDGILGQFRSAARKLLNSGATQREAIERARAAGVRAAGQLPAWARGTTIAPQDHRDVVAVFSAAQLPHPDLRLIYVIVGRLRSLKKTVKRFADALAAGHSEEVAERLRRLIGPAADEILDEFIVSTVASVGNPVAVPASTVGQVTR